MSDLCYNCHQIHLPRACQHPLQECLNCGALGHTWNFCHLGAHRLQVDYKYFALCHNCQKWHLPLPCEETLAQCGGCGQFGHLREYCALDPNPSELFTTSMSSFISHKLTANNTQWIMHNAAFADEIYNIKMGAVMDTLQLVADRAKSEDVRRHLSDAYRGTPYPSSSHHLASNSQPASSQLPASAVVKTESLHSYNPSLPLPRPSIPPQNQVNNLPSHDYHTNHTLAPLQLHKIDTPQPSSLGSSNQTNHGANHAHVVGESLSGSATSDEPVPETLAGPHHTYDGIFSFRAYETAAGRSQEENGNGSSGDGSFTPRSSPCDARASSMEPEHEFFEGSVY